MLDAALKVGLDCARKAARKLARNGRFVVMMAMWWCVFGVEERRGEVVEVMFRILLTLVRIG